MTGHSSVFTIIVNNIFKTLLEYRMYKQVKKQQNAFSASKNLSFLLIEVIDMISKQYYMTSKHKI